MPMHAKPDGIKIPTTTTTRKLLDLSVRRYVAGQAKHEERGPVVESATHSLEGTRPLLG